MSQQVFYESFGEIFFLFPHNYYFHKIIYSINRTWCIWCKGGKCHITSSLICTSSIPNKSVHDRPCPNKCFMNPLGRSFFCSLITISFIELYTSSMGHGIFGVEGVDVSLFPPQLEPALSQTNLCMMLCFPTSASGSLVVDRLISM